MFIRSILVWGVVDGYEYGLDIVVAAAGLAAWVAASAVLLWPPKSVSAQVGGPFTTALIVSQLGRRYRIGTFVAAPICGVMDALVPFAIPTALGWNPNVPADLWLGLPLGIGLTAFAIALTWLVLRGAWHGVELTPESLVARGYFVSRRYSRLSIANVHAVSVHWLPNIVIDVLLRIDITHSLQLSFHDRPAKTLLASNSYPRDARIGVEIVSSWLGIAPIVPEGFHGRVAHTRRRRER